MINTNALLGIVCIILLVAILTLTRRINGLNTRLSQLERSLSDLQNLRERPIAPPAKSSRSVPAPAEVKQARAVATSPKPAPLTAGSPWGNPTKAKKPVDSDPQANDHPKAFVFSSDLVDQAKSWLIQNWFLAVAALSFALSGVFLVQYGVENGLITPFWRVAGAVALGVALLVAGEVLRRKWGDEAGAHTAYLPSTFAGGGLVALSAATIAARQLYGMIGPGVAFAEMVAISLIAIVFGWFYGPFLVIVGIVGAVATPFIVGGSSDTPELFYYYFALITFSGLMVDALRKWAWTSVLAIIATHGAAWFIFSQGASDVHYLVFAFIVSLSATLVPVLQLTPKHDGFSVLKALSSRKPSEYRPAFPTRLAFGAFVAAVGVSLLVAVKDAGSAEVWAAIALILALFLCATVWNKNAVALEELAVFAPIALLAVITTQGAGFGAILVDFNQPLPAESPWPRHVSILTLAGLMISTLAFWRAQGANETKLSWDMGAALYAPLALVALELFWQPLSVLNSAVWAGHAMAIAAAMTFFAERSARRDGETKLTVGMYALSALVMISLAMTLVLTDTALTVALAVMIFGAAALDRWQRLPLISFFIHAGLALISWRLIVEPGIFWAIDAPLWEMLLAFVPVILLIAGGWLVIGTKDRERTRVALESTGALITTVLAYLLVSRALDNDLESHWGVALTAMVGFVSMAAQLHRLKSDTLFPRIHSAGAVVYGATSLLCIVYGLIFANPLTSRAEAITGPYVFDTLLLTFGPMAVLFGLIAWKFTHLSRPLRHAFTSLSSVCVTAYIALEIRRVWRGDILAVSGTTDPELYSYTIAMLLASVIALFVAFARRSVLLRRIAVTGIGVTIAKVFLIDMEGLAGLMRVASFLGLGLSLAALAWVNRRMNEQWDHGTPSDDAPDPLPDTKEEG